MIQLLRDTFLLRADKDLNSRLNIKGHNGLPLFLDTDFNKYQHATQFGEIAFVPLSITDEYINDVPLKVGDKVIIHHFVVNQENIIEADGEKLYRCEYHQLWSKIEGTYMQPLEDFIFVEPMMEPENALRSESGLLHIKRNPQKMRNTGIVFSASKAAKAKGLRMGDRVFFTNDADYDIKIVEKEYYRMRLRNIIAVERDGRLLCLSDKMIVKEIPKEAFSGLLRLQDNRNKKGKVLNIGQEIKGVGIGDTVSYFNGSSTALSYNGEHYAFLTAEQINYKLLEQ